jgi:hypothetical protein
MLNRLSVSIFLSFVAILIAFYSGFVFSQGLPTASPKPVRTGHASLSVSVNVVSTCHFQISSQTAVTNERVVDRAGDRVVGPASGFGARCSMNQPLVFTSNGVLVSATPTSQATVNSTPGATHLNSQSGTPYWAETSDIGLFVTF